VALVSDAGTPTVSDPGGILIRAAIDAGIRVEAIPGASAVLAALAASGLPTAEFTFLGSPPTGTKNRRLWFERARAVGGTVVFFEAPHRIHQTLSDFRRLVADCVVSVGRELTKAHEELVRGPITTVLSALSEVRGEFTVVAFVGQLTDANMPTSPSPIELAREFGDMTAVKGASRRKVLAALARKYGMPPNEVYEALEQVKKSGE
jgi:16S rRNA (cytidine1402-2'-O)-methyltransferase